MSGLEDRCKMCADLGFPDVLAHYKAVPKGASHDGKERPPLCYAHAHGKMPSFVEAALKKEGITVKTQIDPSPEKEPEVKVEPRTCQGYGKKCDVLLPDKNKTGLCTHCYQRKAYHEKHAKSEKKNGHDKPARDDFRGDLLALRDKLQRRLEAVKVLLEEGM